MDSRAAAQLSEETTVMFDGALLPPEWAVKTLIPVVLIDHFLQHQRSKVQHVMLEIGVSKVKFQYYLESESVAVSAVFGPSVLLFTGDMVVCGGYSQSIFRALAAVCPIGTAVAEFTIAPRGNLLFTTRDGLGMVKGQLELETTGEPFKAFHLPGHDTYTCSHTVLTNDLRTILSAMPAVFSIAVDMKGQCLVFTGTTGEYRIQLNLTSYLVHNVSEEKVFVLRQHMVSCLAHVKSAQHVDLSIRDGFPVQLTFYPSIARLVPGSHFTRDTSITFFIALYSQNF